MACLCKISVLRMSVVCNSVCNCPTVREQLKELTKQYDKSENDLKALQSVGQVPHSITLSVLLHLVCSLTCRLALPESHHLCQCLSNA